MRGAAVGGARCLRALLPGLSIRSLGWQERARGARCRGVRDTRASVSPTHLRTSRSLSKYPCGPVDHKGIADAAQSTQSDHTQAQFLAKHLAGIASAAIRSTAAQEAR